MYIKDFEYDGRRISDLGYIVCNIGSGSSVNEIDIGCNITFNTVKNNHSFVYSSTSATYENVFTTSFQIAKLDNCVIEDHISPLEEREINRWFSKKEYKKFKPLLDEKDDLDICFYGSFTVKPVTLGTDTIGFTLEFTGNSPFGYAEPIKSKHMILNTDDEMILYGDSDEITTIYPKVDVRCFSNGTLDIENKLTGNIVHIDNCENGETITIDGEYGIIHTDSDIHQKTLYSDFNYSYLDILADEHGSENAYSISLPCEIIISYSPIRKVGVH